MRVALASNVPSHCRERTPGNAQRDAVDLVRHKISLHPTGADTIARAGATRRSHRLRSSNTKSAASRAHRRPVPRTGWCPLRAWLERRSRRRRESRRRVPSSSPPGMIRSFWLGSTSTNRSVRSATVEFGFRSPQHQAGFEARSRADRNRAPVDARRGAAITVMYVVAAELTKHWFYGSMSKRTIWRFTVAV
jgi:hypothetical protein